MREGEGGMPKGPRIVAGAERRFAALAKAGRRPARAGAAVHHAVTPHARMALCAEEPGAGSGWAAEPGAAVTCPACLRRLETLARAGAAVVVLGPGAGRP
jgi:hypothetical protein